MCLVHCKFFFLLQIFIKPNNGRYSNDTRQNHPGVAKEEKFNLQPGRGEGANCMKSSKTSADNLGGEERAWGLEIEEPRGKEAWE